MSDSYKGFSNRETWSMSVWINNDQGLCENCKGMTSKELRTYIEELKDIMIDSGPIDLKNSEIFKMFDDVGSLWRVNWDEISDACKQD